MKNITLFVFTLTISAFLYFTLRSNTKAERSYHIKDKAALNDSSFSPSMFEVKNLGAFRRIIWSYEAEAIIDHFELQRSTAPDQSFVSFALIAPQNIPGNAYSYNDNNTSRDRVMYYRIAAVGKDGYARFSKIVAVKTEGSTIMTAYPNPATDHISVNFTDMIEHAGIRVVDAQGRPVIVMENFSGNNFSKDLSRFGDGMYYVQVITPNQTINTSFVKKGR